MFRMITAEHLKLKHTFGRKLPVLAPVITLLTALLLTGGIDKAFPAGAWNWWCIMLLPGMLAVLCYLSIKKDKEIKYYNILALHYVQGKSWIGKNSYCALVLVVSNFVIFLGTLIGGYLFGTNISAWDGFCAALLLSISYLWEIPSLLFLSAKFGMFTGIFTSILLAVSGTAILADTALWWVFPQAIPIRLMCPVLGLLPNGLPIPIDSILNNSSVILPGVIISFTWFLVLLLATSFWFQRMEAEG